MTFEEIRSRVRGEIVPVPTQFHEDLSVDYDAIRVHVEFLVDRDTGDVLYRGGCCG